MKRFLIINVFFASLAFCLCSCSWQKAQVTEGIFDVYAPAPYTGAAFSMDEKSSAMRVSLQIRKNDKETWQLEGIENEYIHEDGVKLQGGDANIAYRFKRFPITGSFDYFSKNKISMWGVGIGLDPYPFIRGAVGVNSQNVEAGIIAYLNVSMNTSNNKIEWVSHEYEGMMEGYENYSGTQEGEYQEIKLHGGVGGFINYFPIKSIAISYAPFLYRPWWDDEVRDYEISFLFPFIFTQYFGASVLIAKHVQVSAGATLYLSTAVKGSHWFFDSGIGFVF